MWCGKCSRRNISYNTSEPHKKQHVWGCPVFVLDPNQQDKNKKLPEYLRSRLGQYLGAIGNILSLATGHVSPQYHVVHKHCFTEESCTDLIELNQGHILCEFGNDERCTDYESDNADPD